MIGTATTLRKRAGLLAVLVSSLLVAGPLATERADAVGRKVATMRTLINQERANQGQGRLRYNRKLSKLARRHTNVMADRGDLHHNPNLASQASRLSWTILGENVGVGNSVETLHRAFMDSPPHRHNVLEGRYRRVGIGTKVVGGRLWVTIVFSG